MMGVVKKLRFHLLYLWTKCGGKSAYIDRDPASNCLAEPQKYRNIEQAIDTALLFL